MRTLFLFALLPALAFAQGKKESGGKDAEIRKALAAGLADFAEWCQGKNLLAQGRPLASEALELDPSNAKAKALKDKLAGESTPTDADLKEYEAKKATWGKKLAPYFRELSLQKHTKAQDAQYDGYLVRAYEMDPKGMGPAVDAAWRAAFGKREWEQAHRILTGMEKVATDAARAKALMDCERKVAETAPVLKKATGHPMEYYMMLPKDWSPGKKYHVLVYVEGAGSNFLGGIRNYGESKGTHPFIVVTPQTFSSTNDLSGQKAKYTYPQSMLDEYNTNGQRLKFDEEGLLALLADLRKDYGAEEKIFITGFSGGGNLTWRMVFGHPEMVQAAAPACPNFANAGDLSTHEAREKLPVKVFQGDKDEYIGPPQDLERQWTLAKKTCDENGWKNVTRVMLPGVGHSACVKEVLAFFVENLKK